MKRDNAASVLRVVAERVASIQLMAVVVAAIIHIIAEILTAPRDILRLLQEHTLHRPHCTAMHSGPGSSS